MSADGAPNPAKARTPYSGYYNQPAAPTRDPLTETARGTPAGEYLRRFWHRFMMSIELDKLPKAIKLLSEDLVIFRDGSGRPRAADRAEAVEHRTRDLLYNGAGA